MVLKIGCGKKIRIGYNDKLDCPINAQCGVSKDGNEFIYCDECENIKSGKGTWVNA